MIRKNLIKCKLIRIKSPGKALFGEYMDSFRPEMEQCPHCKAKGCCRIFAYYYRYLIDFVKGRPVVERVRVLRVICTSCNATHAILPDPVIPYEQHSLFFILRVLAEHFFHFKSIERICEAYEISRNTFNRWKSLYEEHWRIWKGTLESIKTTLRDSVLELIRMSPHSAFSSSFFQQTGLSFLQSHKNPAPCQRRQKKAKSATGPPHDL